ncbi:P-loop containing nucleoside triphosphate hydrolase protein [Camillea tinctor]|nr:P-loop containing nucleoside triphosphate hydrolase protein [Camillea tinctor]
MHRVLKITAHKKPFIPSLEQERIAIASKTMNVIVSAVPGSGKTSIIWVIIKADPTARIVTIVYSRQLREEMCERFKEYPQCEFYTCHQAAQVLFGKPVPDDATLLSIRHSRNPPQWTGKLPDIIIIDEIQDSYPLLYWVQCCLIGTMILTTNRLGLKAPRLIALGDERQEINPFRGADQRYLGHCASTMGPFSPYPWKSLTLTTSFRLSHEICRFINYTYPGGKDWLIGSHTGPKPIYIRADLKEVDKLENWLVPLIKEYGPENTAILAPFIRRHYRLPPLTNRLSRKYKFPVSVQTSDESKMDNDVIHGKICVATYHQFKGSERDLVIVLGADESYFEYLGRDLPRDTLPNPVYVALTRARKQLVMVQDFSKAPMPCTQLTQLKETADYINIANGQMEKSSEPETDAKNLRIPARVFVAQLVRHIPDESLKPIFDEHLITTPMAEPGHLISVPEKVLTNKRKRHYEAVSDLNGLVALAAYEYEVHHSLVSLGFDSKERPIIPIDRDERAAWLCKKACEFEAKLSKYESRKIQMAKHPYNWMKGSYLENIIKRLAGELQVPPELLNFELPLSWKGCEIMESSGEIATTKLYGFADIVVSTGKQAIIWEIKFKSTDLSLTDAIQLAIYGYLWHTANPHQEPPRMYLYNVRTGEKKEVKAKGGIAELKELIKELLKVKYFPRPKSTNEQFLEECKKIREEVQELFRQMHGGRKGST